MARIQLREVRELSYKAMEDFQARVSQYSGKLQGTWALVTKDLDEAIKPEQDANFLKQLEHSITLRFDEHRTLEREYEAYLRATRTQESAKLLAIHMDNNSRCERAVNSVLDQIDLKIKLQEKDIRKQVETEQRPARSISSNSSTSSKARAKADAAKARLAFAEKELLLKKKQAILKEEQALMIAKTAREQEEIDADLSLLKEKKEYAEAKAEADYYEIIDEWQESPDPPNSLGDEPMLDPMERTEQYTRRQAPYISSPPPGISTELSPNTPAYAPREKEQQYTRQEPHFTSDEPHDTQSISAQSRQSAPPNLYHTESSLGIEFGRFLVKKDLLMSRFTKFQDDPVTYTVWKDTFKNITEDLGVTPQEETDLLVKWLGPESSRQALNLRAANTHNPTRGLMRIWQRLDERYGAPELVESTLRKKINNFPKLGTRDTKKLYDLLDLLMEVESLKETPKHSSLLASYDSSVGINPIVVKLPYHLQNKWMGKAMKHKLEHNAVFPPFTFFVKFIREQAVMLNDPSFIFEAPSSKNQNLKEERVTKNVRHISTHKTAIADPSDTITEDKKCPLHPNSNTHALNVCKEFMRRPIEERRQIIKENHFCFRCCNSTQHQIKDCKADIRCDECNSPKHVTALHIKKPSKRTDKSVKEDQSNAPSDGGEEGNINSKCTQVCGSPSVSKSCAKIVKVNVFQKDTDERMTVYALIDDQSNRSLATPTLLDSFRNNKSFETVQYSLTSCAGTVRTTGRRAPGFMVESIDSERTYELPPLIECPDIPGNREEIPTSDAAAMHPHLRDIAADIPPLDKEIGIHMLLGRDVVDIHHVIDQRIGPTGTPYGQKLGLGWVIIGDVCLGKIHTPDLENVDVRNMKTHVVNGRHSIFPQCELNLSIKEDINTHNLFVKTKKDEEVGWSIEDRQFVELMDKECHRNEEGYWTAPLPFRVPRPKMPNNRRMALQRAMVLHNSLQKNPVKRDHFVTFMEKVLSSGAAELAPTVKGEAWYLPIFGVYNPQKPNQIRGVFDSSAKYEGLSLNDTLLSGPNLTNDLLGILIRFRENAFAAAADIEQMFYSFHVEVDHRDFLRFLWYRDNDPNQELVEYRMKAHVFGNSPSPAVAAYGLKRTVEVDDVDKDVKDFVNNNFYVDDGLISLPSETEVISLLQRTQTALLSGGNLRLHKLISNSPIVMSAFPTNDLSKEVKTLQLDKDDLPTHRSLGLLWELNVDSFLFNIQLKDSRHTRRGVLSVLNSIFDPLGFASPITIRGKILMRDITKGYGWDDPLDDDAVKRWKAFEESLVTLHELSIPRMIVPMSLRNIETAKLHIFSDASEQAICAVAYLTIHSEKDSQHTGFVLGKAKVAPSNGHTIPRLELCAAVMGAELAQTVQRSLSISIASATFHTDSKVVLGYIHNKKKRFHHYVANRVQRILEVSDSGQWVFVPTKENPADFGTRGLLTAKEVQEKWICGPNHVKVDTSLVDEEYPLVDPEEDKEIRVTSHKTEVNTIMNDRTERFSDWSRLLDALCVLKRAIRKFKTTESEKHILETQDLRKDSENFLIAQCQKNQFPEEIDHLRNGKPVSGSSPISSLNPILDNNGILRVGGRLNQGYLPYCETNPVILPGKSHIATLIVRHFHQKTKHQGRIFTEGSVRKNGYWIIGAKRLVSRILHQCITCRKLRGNTNQQIMADLPSDRLTPGPPFTSVGIDTFGPWPVVSRRTRGGMAQSKRWAIMFTCLTTRGVHIEVIEDMSSSSFINALRRLIALRGNVKEIRSDRGTNFVGAADELGMNIINVEDKTIHSCLKDANITWRFNAPHSSHMGGVWERMIGIARNILNSMLLDVGHRDLTHEVLVTLMAEISAIMNSRPLTSISSDPEDPLVLTPAMLLNVQHSPSISVDLSVKDMHKKQWRMVQVLSDTFWKRWQLSYLQSLQTRRKWRCEYPSIKNGDVVLLKDKCLARNEWSMGVVVNSIKSQSDDKVRKAEVRTYREGKYATYTRPITDMVVLVD